jgi:hypothetical protein
MGYLLQEGSWYAAEFLGDDLIHAGHRYSPIRVELITPLKTGNRIFELKFFHANYPAGVQDKTYRLQTLHAGEEYILARSVEHDPVRFVLIYDIDLEWLREHFQVDLAGRESAEDWLNREFRIGRV